MKRENLKRAITLVEEIGNLELLLVGKQANCRLTVTNKDGDIFTFDEDSSKKIQSILEKERDRLIVAYNRLDRE